MHSRSPISTLHTPLSKASFRDLSRKRSLTTSTHNTLSTFLAHATSTNLSPTSTTYIGTHYEYTTLHALSRFGLALIHTGGRDDRGVDLCGAWALPNLIARRTTHPPDGSHPCTQRLDSNPLVRLRTFVQCKALAQKPSPSLIRELSGAFTAAERATRRVAPMAPASPILGILAAPQPATAGTRAALTRAGEALAFVCVTGTGKLRQVLWNRAAGEAGLGALRAEVRYAPEGERGDGEVVLLDGEREWKWVDEEELRRVTGVYQKV